MQSLTFVDYIGFELVATNSGGQEILVFHLTGFGGWADGRKQNLVQWTVMSSSKSREKEIALNKQWK